MKQDKSLLKLISIIAISLSASACTNLFLQPDRVLYPQVENLHLVTNEVEIFSGDKTRLCAWDFPVNENQKARPDAVSVPATEPFGLVLQVHGNALNMSNHFQSVAWLPFAGYELVTFDYRGYGASEGKPDVGGSVEDTKAAIRYMDEEAGRRGLKWALVGQSLGGSLALRALEEQKTENLRLVLIESSFYAYKELAQEKLASTWITWPIQWLAKLLISDQYSPGGSALATVAPKIPIILLYSTKDNVIPYSEGQRIFTDLRDPKVFWSHDDPGHINGFATPDRRYRKMLIEALRSNVGGAAKKDGTGLEERKPASDL